MIRRRQSLAAIAGALAVPRLASAQTKAKRRLAFVHPTILVAATMAARSRWSRMFFTELARLGYSEDTNLSVEPWSAQGVSARYDALVRDILATGPDVILVWSDRLSLAFRKAGGNVPVVFLATRAVELGLVESVARPGGNMTGVTAEDLTPLLGKAVELLHEIVPSAKTIALLSARGDWESGNEMGFGESARRRGLTPVGLLLDDPIGPAEYRRVFSQVGVRGVDLLATIGASYRSLIVGLAAEYQLPACHLLHDMDHYGEMLAYGPDPSDHPRVVAGYIARVLNGEKPAEMPVESPGKYKLVVNLKTAMALGLTIPPTLLARADEVIE